MNKTDSLIFDMDGTLWDAVDSYCAIWDKTLIEFNCSRKISRLELIDCMGKPLRDIFITLNIDISNINEFLSRLDENENSFMPVLGGKLYDGVTENIKILAQHYKLFMVSNCGADGLNNFLNFTKLKEYFIDTVSYGQTNKEKYENIKYLVNKHNLKSPIYVGDTQSDCNNAHKAGIKMIYTSYGFGNCSNAEYTISKFSELTDLLLLKI